MGIKNRALAVWAAGFLLLVLVVGLALDRVFPFPLAKQPVGQPAATVVVSRDKIPLRAFADGSGANRDRHQVQHGPCDTL